MNGIEEIVSQKNENQQKERERKALASDIGSHFSKTVLSLQEQNKILAEGLKKVLGVVSQIKTQNSAGVQVDTGKLEGILTTLVSKISDIKIPEIKLPGIIVPKPDTPIVPKPEVTVNVPPAKITVRPNITVRSTETKESPKVVEEKEIYKEGFLDGWERKFDNGDVVQMTGASIGKRKYEYR